MKMDYVKKNSKVNWYGETNLEKKKKKKNA
jgi:hypothetical protein